MKAWTASRAGQPQDILELRTDWPKPAAPTAGYIMVRVSHVALNPGDLKMMAHNVPFRGTFIPGMDIAGEVVEVGQPIPTTSFTPRVGMKVAGTMSMMNVWRGVGALAEYVVLPASVVVEVPAGLECSAAAGLLGVAGQTSYVLTCAANLRKGDKALVNGASGGVGCILVQALRGMGVQVTGISSAKNEAMVRRLGAQEFIDYTAHDSLSDHLRQLCTEQGVQPFNAIFDCVGNDTLFHRSPSYLKVDGKFLSIEAGPFGFLKFMNWPTFLGGTPRRFTSVFSTPSGDSARAVAEWFENGWIKDVPIDSLFKMEEVSSAFQKLATQRTAGKIIIEVKGL